MTISSRSVHHFLSGEHNIRLNWVVVFWDRDWGLRDFGLVLLVLQLLLLFLLF